MDRLLKLFLFSAFILLSEGKISDQRLCGDPKCSEPVSLAKTLIRYNSDDARILSFPSNVDVKIFSKSAGTRMDLWGVEIGGKRGYAPKNLLRENKVLHKKLEFVVATENDLSNEINTDPIADSLNSDKAEAASPAATVPLSKSDTLPLPAEIRKPYEVHDGTTFYLTASSDNELPPPPIQASITESNLKASAVDNVAQVDEPNASMLLPSSATSSEEYEGLNTMEEEEGSAKGIYNYISSFLPGDGSGSKDTTEESSEEYDDDEDYEEEISEEEDDEELSKEEGKLNLKVENAVNLDKKTMPTDSDVKEDSNMLESQEILTNAQNKAGEELKVIENLAAEQTVNISEKETSESLKEMEVIANSANKVEQVKTSVGAETSIVVEELIGVNKVVNMVNVIGQEESNEAQVTFDSKLENVSLSVEVEKPETVVNLSNETLNDNIEVEASNHQAEIISKNINFVNTDKRATDEPLNLSVELPSVDSEVPSFPQTTDHDVEVNSHSEPVNSQIALDKVDAEGSEAPVPARSIFDLISNRDSRPDEIVVTEVPQATDDSENKFISPEIIEDTSDFENKTLTGNGESKTPLYENNTIINDSVTRDETGASEDAVVLDNNTPENVADAGYFSSLSNFLMSVFNVFASTPLPPDPVEDLNSGETKTVVKNIIDKEIVLQQAENDGDKMSTSWLVGNTGAASDCVDTIPEVGDTGTYSILPPLSQVVKDIENSGPALSLIITAVTVLLFTLGYYFIEKSRRDSSFIAKINVLERSLFLSSKECQIIKHDLETTKGMLTDEHSSLATRDTLTDELYAELDERKVKVSELEEHIKTLQQELEAATDAGLEVNRMLTEVLSQNTTTNSLFESFEDLQNQLKLQQCTILKMDDALHTKNAEVESLQTQIRISLERINTLNGDIKSLNTTLNDTLQQKLIESTQLQDEISVLYKQIEQYKDSALKRNVFIEEQLEDLETELNNCKAKLASRDVQIDVLKTCFEELKLEDSETRIQSLMDVSKTMAQLKTVTREKDELVEKLEDEQGARAVLEDHNRRIDKELTNMRVACMTAEENALDANTKLSVLSKYFDEKEALLQKDLGRQESAAIRITGEASSVQLELDSLSQQNTLLKTQNETLREEILDQEKQRKDQVKLLENKFNDSWLASKQLERKLEEAKQECASLRNRLTNAERQALSPNDSRLVADLNGDLPTSPLHMGLVDLPIFPPHLGGSGIPFMPPPSYPQDRRPPPLGCMSSPPLLPPPITGSNSYARHYDRHSPDMPAFRGSRPPGAAGFRPLPPTANKGSNAGSSHSSESLDHSNHQV